MALLAFVAMAAALTMAAAAVPQEASALPIQENQGVDDVVGPDGAGRQLEADDGGEASASVRGEIPDDEAGSSEGTDGRVADESGLVDGIDLGVVDGEPVAAGDELVEDGASADDAQAPGAKMTEASDPLASGAAVAVAAGTAVTSGASATGTSVTAGQGLQAGAATVSVAAEDAELESARSGALAYIDKNKRKYKDSISKKQSRRLSKFRNRIMSAGSTDDVKLQKDKSRSLFKKVKRLHKKKARLVKKTKKLYKSNKRNMISSERKSFKRIIKKIRTSKSMKATKPYVEKRDLIVKRAKMSAHIWAHNWSDAKLDFVERWAKRNNRFLRGTHMSGTGYFIASSAYDHNIDPRLCAAVAMVESGCGAAPYGSRYNVWGWICGAPSMHSWRDAIEKWTRYFSSLWRGDWYPISSMHGYGGYGPEYVNRHMARI